MPVNKPRVLAGAARPAARDTYDRRAATALPSATGGAPAQSVSSPLAAATGNEMPGQDQERIIQTPTTGEANAVGQTVQDMRMRYATRGTMSQLPLLNRSIQDYTQNNQEIVNQTKMFLEQEIANGKDVLGGAFQDTDEMARWAVAHIMRSFEPGPAPSVPDMLYQSRQGRRIMALTSYLREAQNAGA